MTIPAATVYYACNNTNLYLSSYDLSNDSTYGTAQGYRCGEYYNFSSCQEKTVNGNCIKSNIETITILNQIQPNDCSLYFACFEEYPNNANVIVSNPLKKIINLSNLDTSNASNMYGMFTYCDSLTQLDLSSFNTSNVIDMNEMFFYCDSLKTIYSNNFNISNVIESNDMFSGCTSLMGAVPYDSTKVDASMANYETGYFTNPAIKNAQAYVLTLQDKDDNIIYPQTVIDAIQDTDGTSLRDLLSKSSDAINPDWNENNSSSSSYIKNRTHYIDGGHYEFLAEDEKEITVGNNQMYYFGCDLKNLPDYITIYNSDGSEQQIDKESQEGMCFYGSMIYVSSNNPELIMLGLESGFYSQYNIKEDGIEKFSFDISEAIITLNPDYIPDNGAGIGYGLKDGSFSIEIDTETLGSSGYQEGAWNGLYNNLDENVFEIELTQDIVSLIDISKPITLIYNNSFKEFTLEQLQLPEEILEEIGSIEGLSYKIYGYNYNINALFGLGGCPDLGQDDFCFCVGMMEVEGYVASSEAVLALSPAINPSELFISQNNLHQVEEPYLPTLVPCLLPAEMEEVEITTFNRTIDLGSGGKEHYFNFKEIDNQLIDKITLMINTDRDNEGYVNTYEMRYNEGNSTWYDNERNYSLKLNTSESYINIFINANASTLDAPDFLRLKITYKQESGYKFNPKYIPKDSIISMNLDPDNFLLIPSPYIDGYYYSFEEDYPISNFDIQVELEGDYITADEIDAWCDAKIVGSNIRNRLVCKGEKPTIEIPVILTIKQVEQREVDEYDPFFVYPE